MKIGVFGCTADPFTPAHGEIVKQALEQHLVDKVLIAPTIVTWHRADKKPWLTDAEKMEVISKFIEVSSLSSLVSVWTRDLRLKARCQGNSGLEKRFVESRRFIDTLMDIKLIHSGDEISVIIGTDSWEHFKEWSSWKEIASLASKILVADGRAGSRKFMPDPEIPNAESFSIDPKFSEMSASDFREKFKSVSSYLEQVFGKKREVLLHTPIFDVVRGEVTPTGLKPVLVDAPDWVTIIAEKDEEFLIVKQLRYGAGQVIEEFPCGMVEKDEAPENAALRELEEETGIRILDKCKPVKLGSTNPNPAFMLNTMHYFYINLNFVKHELKAQKLDQHEQIEYAWKSKSCFMFDTLDDAHSGSRPVPAIAVAALKLYEHASTYPCGG